ncbi:DNA damage response protein RcaA [Xylariales sp. AK1849]|nr:DNA damage response protein RcaA [Xylariales sp. AK1849]
MWLLENEGDAFDGKRLWLRPGKRYLFGRTVAEPGMLAIHGEKASSVSRKHVTIQVDPVREGDSQNLSSRSKVTVGDLGSKSGTVVNGQKIKGEHYVVTQETNTLKMGSMAGFRITWFPVVLSFSFTRRELQSDAVTKLRVDLEQLDIKFLSDYDVRSTTHVVSKRRNTSKGLQALINGRSIVNDTFVNAIVGAAKPEALDAVERSPLEGDFDTNWPNALECLPAAGNEPVTRPPEAFVPDAARAEMFDGYTFIFYDQTQYDSLLGPITNGKGKALHKEVIPRETQIDDFVRYVKSIAGEKGLGGFENGSEGMGVVVVKYLPKEPTQPEDIAWFEQFYTAVSLRLDHRLVDQKDFLDAILGSDASVLRRPLEVETPHTSQPGQGSLGQEPMDVDGQEAPAGHSQVSAPRRRVRGAAKKRFKGFVADSDSDGEGELPESVPAAPSQSAAAAESSQEGLFVSQDARFEDPGETIQTARQSQRKRPASRISQGQSIEDDFAPTAAQLKRRRIAAGEDPLPRRPSPVMEPQENPASTTTKDNAQPKMRMVKKEIDVMEVARKTREEAEARALAEREDLALGVEDLDLAEIRRLQIEEPMPLRSGPVPVRTRDRDVADGRWDPAWNGRKNFKKFQRRGAVTAARPPQTIIVPLEEAKNRAFGMGDNYWLEDEQMQKRKQKETERERRSQKSQAQSKSQNASGGTGGSQKNQRGAAVVVPAKRKSHQDDDYDSDANPAENDPYTLGNNDPTVVDDEDEDDVILSSSRRRATRQTETQPSPRSLRTTQKSQPSRNSKRPAAAPPAKEQSAKSSRVITIAASDDDDDESEDELRFRFRRR